MLRMVLAGTMIALAAMPGCRARRDAVPADGAPSFAFITNGVADFWEHARIGAETAGKELGVGVTVITPSSMTDQTRKIEDLLTRGIDGIAISPIDSDNQLDAINRAAAETILITHDSDAPDSDRLLYIGIDNYQAGLMCGATLRKALPEGGKVMIFIGRMDQDNSKRRRQGFIDSFLGRPPDPSRNDPPGATLASDDGRYTILGTMIDGFDRAKAKANVEDAVTRHPDLAGMVGLFEYNPPAMLEGLERTGMLGKVKVMGFDENASTLEGIRDGTVVATVVQNPYQYGYQSIKVLHQLHKGDKSVLSESRFIDIPARVIDSSNVDEFAKEIEDRLQ